MDERLVKRLLDLGDTMMDPGQRKVLHGSMLMEMLAEVTEARDEYVATYAMLHERGIDIPPDHNLIKAMSDLITTLAQDAAAVFES
jgi:hypothetical protein